MVARTSPNLDRTNPEAEQAPTGVRIATVADDRDGQRIDNFLQVSSRVCRRA